MLSAPADNRFVDNRPVLADIAHDHVSTLPPSMFADIVLFLRDELEFLTIPNEGLSTHVSPLAASSASRCISIAFNAICESALRASSSIFC